MWTYLARYALRWHKIKWVRALQREAELEAELADKGVVVQTLAARDEEVASLKEELRLSHEANRTLKGELEVSQKQAAKAGDYFEEVVFLRGQVIERHRIDSLPLIYANPLTLAPSPSHPPEPQLILPSHTSALPPSEVKG